MKYEDEYVCCDARVRAVVGKAGMYTDYWCGYMVAQYYVKNQ